MPKCFPSDVSPTNWLLNKIEVMSRPDQNFFIREFAARLFGLVAAAPCGVLSSAYNVLALSKTPVSVCTKIAFPCDPIEDVIGKEFKVSELCKHSYKIFAYVFSTIFSPLLTFVYPRFSIWLHEKTLLKEAGFLPPLAPPPPSAPPLPMVQVQIPTMLKAVNNSQKNGKSSHPSDHHAVMLAHITKRGSAIRGELGGLTPEEVDAKMFGSKAQKSGTPIENELKDHRLADNNEHPLEEPDDEDDWESEDFDYMEDPLEEILRRTSEAKPVVACANDSLPITPKSKVQPGILAKMKRLMGKRDVRSALANQHQLKAVVKGQKESI